MVLSQDLLNPTRRSEKTANKKKRLVQGPNSYFIDVKCSVCTKISTIFSNASTVIDCSSCGNLIASPTGGKVKLREGTSFRIKQ